MSIGMTTTTYDFAPPGPPRGMGCDVCGAKVVNWTLHESWHEKLGGAVEQPTKSAGE